ncbi:MAG TPA: hypothetical protein VFO85_08825, partial [Vicinamibacteria bacterium]|nr:hypothetical protein [Vicinamibacteria bacterium]
RSEAAQATLAQATGPWTWFNFLFKSEPHGEGAFSGQAFVAAETAAVRPCVDRSGTCNGPLEDEEAPAASGQTTVKALRSKRPDLVQIFAAERRIEVLDPSFRWHEAWHNFKTQFYCAVLRLAFPGWQVAGLDYRDARRNRLA